MNNSEINTNQKTGPKIFLLYETGQIEEALQQTKQGATLICLDYLLERECKKRNISFAPLRDFVDSETGEEEWWKLSHDISREWYRLSVMEFFQYKGIRIAEAPEPIMQAYLAKLFYFVRIFLVLKERHPDAHFSIPVPTNKSTTSNECLVAFQSWSVIDAARMVGLIKTPPISRNIPKTYTFTPPSKKSIFLRLYNFLIGLIPRKKFKIYLSGYWPHAESLVPYLKGCEIMLLESKRLFEIPWRQILKHRIRVFYSHNPISNSKQFAVYKECERFMKQWPVAKLKVAEYLSSIRRDLDWTPVLEACEHLVIYGPRVVADINLLYQAMQKEKPNLVLQMASVGGPHHYFLLMARIAKQLKITSVELQHATVTIDPRSVFCRIETDYLLTYGSHINGWHERMGNATKNRLIAAGSPRFDQYVNDFQKGLQQGKVLFNDLGLDMTRPVLLVPVPFSETYASAVDSYQLAEFFETILQVQKSNPGLQILFKCRVPKLVEVTREYLKELFTTDWAISGVEEIFPMICASTAVICNNSTVIYQAVLARKPLVLYPWKRFDSYHAQLYVPWIPILYNANEAIKTLTQIFKDKLYRDGLLMKQEQFLRGYLFDGRSSERVAELLKVICLTKNSPLPK